MTEIRVSSQDVAALGETLQALSSALEDVASVGAEACAFGGGGAAGKLDRVLADWKHQRLQTGRYLHDLGAAAKVAGAGYVTVEAADDRLMTGGATE